jgi:DNA repair protein RecO (recombination protein O)
MNSRSYKANGIVLRARNLGEADKNFTLFTDAHGKRDVVAKGVRRLKSRTASRLEFASEASFVFYQGRNLDCITAAELLRSRRPAITQPEGFVAAHMMIEPIDALCEPELALPEVYALLNGALDALAAVADPQGLLPRFQARLLGALGFAPYDAGCVECGCALEKEAWAHVDAGGLACARCRPSEGDALMLESRDILNFRALAAPRASSARAALRATPAAARAMDIFLSYHLGRRLKSRGVLREMPFFHS